jgi:GntR family transcriptional regulator
MGALDYEIIPADETSAAALEIAEQTPVLRIKRVIFTGNQPIAYLEDILPEGILDPAALKEGFTGSVLDSLLKRGNPPLSHSKTDISATAATPEIARALQIQRSDVLLAFTAQLVTKENRVIDYSISYFIPGYFRFHVVRRVGSILPNPIGS